MLTERRTSHNIERGQVMILFALLIPVMFGIGSIVLSVGNWYVHKKHLQTLVDAGAFAGGTAFSACRQDPTNTDIAIANTALQYAGDTTRDPTTQNTQVQEPNDVHVVLNSNRYWSKGDPTDGSTFDNTLGTPCAERFLDVKGTDLELPLLWRWIPLFPSAKAKARVEILQVIGQAGMLPWAVPEVDPKTVGAVIVNEDTGAVVGAFELVQQATRIDNLNTFSGIGTAALGNGSNFGVVIVLSKDPAADVVNGTLQDICTRDPVQTKCWRGSTSTSGLRFVRKYSDSASPVVIRSVELAAVSGCASSPTAPYFARNGPCTVQITDADIDFGTNTPVPDPTCGRVSASPGGTLTWVNDSSHGGRGKWVSGSISLSPGRNVVTLTVENKRAGATGTNCSQRQTVISGERVAAPYLADDDSGPVEYLDVRNGSGLAVNSLNGGTQNLTITVGVTPPFEVVDNWNDPLALLRITSNSSQTQAVDCDDNTSIGPTGLQHSNFRNEIVDGCLTYYTENARNGDCSNYGFGSLPPPTTLSNPVDDCVVTQTGVSAGQIRQAIDARFGFDGGATCKTLNNWPKLDPSIAGNPGYPDPLIDKRYVVLFIVDDTSFSSSGQDIYPIRRFGGFYVTGGDGLNCPGDDPAPAGVRQASVWGHFMTYVVPEPTALISNELCNFDDVGTCIAVLVE